MFDPNNYCKRPGLSPDGYGCEKTEGHEGMCGVPRWPNIAEWGVDSPAEVPAKLTEAQRRKGQPIATGVLQYFPDAIAAVAEVSRIGNEQHNPGEPLHWAKEKSQDEPDCVARHLTDWLAGIKFEKDGSRVSAKIAWRALALCQRERDAEKKAGL